MYKLSILKNKLKVITHNIPGAHGVTTGVFVGVGSRYEDDEVAGVSHFLEHMLFKGTKKRPTPAEIARGIEGIGGYTNAATSQDYTFFYNRVPARHFGEAVDFLADILNNSLFDEQAAQREKGVVLEELNMILDTPSHYIYNLLMNLMWPNSPLGRDIIGTRDSIVNLTRDDVVDYIRDKYQPQRMVVSVAGKVEHRMVVDYAKRYFGRIGNGGVLGFAKIQKHRKHKNTKRILIHNKKTDQVHLCLGAEGIGYDTQDEPVLALLDTILGTGMSSRLFLKIREEQGLCYAINSFIEKFKEIGLVGVSAGLNIGKIDLAVKAIAQELKKLTKEKVSKVELKEAKEYVRGNLSLQMDNSDNMAIWYGSQGLFYKKIQTPEQKIKKLLQVTENDIIRLARKLFRVDKLRLALIGPFEPSDEERFLRLIRN